MLKNLILLAGIMLACNLASADMLELKDSAMSIKSSSFNHDYKPKLKVLNKSAIQQIEAIKVNADFAKQQFNPELEVSFLKKLALVKGKSSDEYLIAKIRYDLNVGGKNRDEAKRNIQLLCQRDDLSNACLQASALYEITSSQMRMRLQPFIMHENNSDYENAVKDIIAIFKRPPLEHQLRYRYYIMLGNIENKEQEAIKGLLQITKEDPTNTALNQSIFAAVEQFKAIHLARAGLKGLDSKDKSVVQGSIKKLNEAIKTDPKNKAVAYWQEMLDNQKYFDLVDLADSALDKKDFKKAIEYYQRASKILPNSPYAFIGLARSYINLRDLKGFHNFAKKALKSSLNESIAEQKRIKASLAALEASYYETSADKALNQGNNALAIENYQKALSISKDNVWTYYALASLYASQKDEKKALSLFQAIKPQFQNDLEYVQAYSILLSKCNQELDAINVLLPFKGKAKEIDERIALLKTQAQVNKAQELYDKDLKDEALKILATLNQDEASSLRANIAFDNNDYEKAAFYYEKALKDAPDSFYYKLQFVRSKALAYQKNSPDEFLQYVANNQNLENSKTITKTQEQLNLLLNELELTLNKQALEPTAEDLRQLAALYSDLGFFNKEKNIYLRALNIKDTNLTQNTKANNLKKHEEIKPTADTKLERIENNADDSKTAYFFKELQDFDRTRRIIKEYQTKTTHFLHTAFIKKLEILMSKLLKAHIADNTEPLSFNDNEHEELRDRAWLARNLGQSYKKTHESNQKQLDAYRLALGLYNNRLDEYQNDKVYTHDLLTKDEPTGDWLLDSIKANGAKSYQRENVIIQNGIRLIKDSGHSGYSDNKGFVNVLNISMPFLDGRASFQTDYTMLNPGALQGGSYNDLFGTCFVNGCTDTSNRKRKAQTYALAFDNDYLHIDLGTSPSLKNKHKTDDIVGGISFKTELSENSNWSITTEAYKRAKDNSLLTYIGEKDFDSQKYWGAVKKYGIAQTQSYYINEDSGLWFNEKFEKLSGKNVLSNTAITAMTGYYFHLINRPNERFDIAPMLMYTGYKHDLSGYTVGQGGYYSPQDYLSLSLSLRYLRRFENTSIATEVFGSVSKSKTKSQRRYPIAPAIMLDDINASSDNETTTSFGGGLRLAIEQRLSSHLSLGTSISLVKSEDYSPMMGMLYFKYYYDAWLGDLPMPPSGPTPYVEW